MTYLPPPPGPGYPPPFAPVPTAPSRTPGIVAAIVLYVVAVLLAAVGSVVAFVSVVFLDYCPPPSCSTDAAADVVATTWIVAGLVLIVSVVGIVVASVRRRRPWVWGLVAVVGEMLTFGVAAMAYSAAVS